MHTNPELGALRKVKWEEIESFPQKRRFSPKIDGLIYTILLGPPLRTYPISDLGPVEGPEGYRMHTNPELGALRKVKWEEIESFPQKRRFSPKVDGLL